MQGTQISDTGFSLTALEYGELLERGKTVLRGRILKPQGSRAFPGNYMTMNYDDQSFTAKVLKVIEIAGKADILIEKKIIQAD